MNNELIRLAVEDALKNGLVMGLYEQWRNKQADYDIIDRYWHGEHPLAFATEKFSNAFGTLFRAMSDNYCKRVCNALSDYLQLKSITSSDETKTDLLSNFWEFSRLDYNSGLIHTSAFRYGDGYAIVSKNSTGKERLYKQNSRSIRVMYDDEEPDLITLALKCWQRLDGYWRLNVYVPGRVFRFVTRNKSQGTVPPVKLSSYIEYTDGNGSDQPTSSAVIPVFHFPNEPGHDGNGGSELIDIMPQQDGLNKSVCDMLVAAEYQAFKQRWATGIEIEIDEVTGLPKPPAVNAIDRLLFSGNEEAKFGEFGQIDLKGFLEVSEAFRYEIARLSCIPLHHLGMLSGGWPSGEAMKTADIPMEAKKRDRQICWGNEWEAVACYILGIDPDKATADLVKSEWEDVSPRNDLAEAQADQYKAIAAQTRLQLGVSKKQVLKELGYSDPEIEQFDIDNANDQTVMEGKVLDYFNRGGQNAAIPIGGGSGGSGGSGGGKVLPALPKPAV